MHDFGTRFHFRRFGGIVIRNGGATIPIFSCAFCRSIENPSGIGAE